MLTKFLFHGTEQASRSTHAGLLLFRFIIGLSYVTVFDKMLPSNGGNWGPPEWFVGDVAEMGFPAPLFFAWCAVLAEFIGGILLMFGLLTRVAAFFLIITMGVAFFIQHGGNPDNGLLAIVYFFMTTSLFLTGPGTFSIDHLLYKRSFRLPAVPRAFVCLLLVGFLLTFSGCAFIGSTVWIQPGEEFRLGENRHGTFKVSMNNLGKEPIYLEAESLEGLVVKRDTLPGRSFKTLRFPPNTVAVFQNPGSKETRVRVRISGDTNLSMGYESMNPIEPQ